MMCTCNKIIEKVGNVELEERDEIQKLYSRKMALKELLITLQQGVEKNGRVDDVLYERVINDMAETNQKFQNWWDKSAKKYGWKSHPKGHWTINFDTCEIFLEVINDYEKGE